MRRKLEFRQACAIAKAVIVEDATIDNLEWQERIKDRLIRQGYTYPDDWELLHRAMAAAGHLVPRQAPARPAPRPEPEPEVATPEGLAMRDEFMEKLRLLARKHTIPTVHGPTKTAEQIDAWRQEQFVNRKPTHRKTAKGWVRL